MDFNDNFLALYWKCLCVGPIFFKNCIHKMCAYREVPGYKRSRAPVHLDTKTKYLCIVICPKEIHVCPQCV